MYCCLRPESRRELPFPTSIDFLDKFGERLMVKTYFSESTLDDLMRIVMKEIKDYGCQINPTKGPARELSGVLLEVTNPRARISRTETRGKPYSCLGELCWYLAKTRDLQFIEYYIKQYRLCADGDQVYGGYGPRLFDWKKLNQLDNVIELFRRKPSSRQAVVQLFDALDLIGEHKDIPCTCTLQFMIREDGLHMLTSMRSNDAFWGLPHDVFCFTMLREIVARTLSVEVGVYKHVVGSLHLYEKSMAATERFLDEGWQSTMIAMPPMPAGDPWPAIKSMLSAEFAIRTGDPEVNLLDTDPYWADLIRLLQVFRAKKDKDRDKISLLRNSMSSNVYSTFINKALN